MGMKILELTLWLTGAMLIAGHFGAQTWSERERGQGVAAFTAAQANRLPSAATHDRRDANPDTPLAMIEYAVAPAIAVLRIERIALEVPIGYGTEERVLRRGAGFIEGTAQPGHPGNVGIAAHRDTFFRPLQGIVPGDLIVLDTPHDTQTYRVTELSIVQPEDVHVLHDRGEAMLTLVTCYPFRFIGNAPQRFIVHAVPASVSM